MALNRYKNKRSRRGFSLTEMLIVIAIIAVLAAVAVPSLVAVQKNLKTTELDSAARSIFVAAQNHMSNLRENDFSVKLDGVAPMSGKPVGFPDSLDWDSGEYCYISSSSTGIDKLLPAVSIDQTLWDGTFYIEYNAKSGMVYSVFYAEEDFSYFSNLPRDSSGRKKYTPQLGYFGGSSIDMTVLGELEAPEFIIHNDEKSLRVEFTEVPSAEYTLEITSGGTPVTYYNHDFATALSSGKISHSGSTYTIILDKPADSMHFRELFPALTPGADLEIKLTVSSADGKKLPASTIQTTNSLFASRSGGEATIKNMRHLQNLHTAVSYVTNEVTSAVVSEPIDAAGFYAESYSFASISNANLISFNGNGNEINGLKSPLFDTFGSGNIKNVYLVNSKITASTGNVGTLVNTATGTILTDCRAYANGAVFTSDDATLSSTDAANTGGLIGHATGGSLTQCFAALNLISASSGNTGGLVGGAENVNFSMCYADMGYWDASTSSWHKSSGALDVGIISASGAAGGFAGSVSGGTIANCYAVGAISAKGGSAASFAGITTVTASYSNCYGALRFVDCTATSLFGFTNINTGTNCHYLSDSSVTDKNNVATYAVLTTCMKSGGWGIGATNAYGLGTAAVLPFPSFTAIPHYGDWESSPAKIYYYEMYFNKTTNIYTYGFHNEEYDTLLPGTSLTSTLYIVEDGYALLSDSYAEGDEIEISYSTGSSSDVDRGLTAEEVTEQGSNKKLIGIFMRPVLANTGVLETIAYATTPAPQFSVSYAMITVDSADFFFLPAFAKCAVNDDIVGAAAIVNSATKPFEICTARQLVELQRRGALTPALLSGKFYLQTADIDFAKYVPEYSMLPIGSSTNPFTNCAYDGGSFIITGTDIVQTSGGGGLFANVNGVTGGTSLIKNVILLGSADSKITGGTGTGATGGLVGTLSGSAKIDNCIVSGFDISGGGNVGGLVGDISGTAIITNSAAVSFTENCCAGGSISSTNASSGVGGIAGNVGGSADISTTYAIASISNTSTTGGIYGSSSSGSKTTDCYGFTLQNDAYITGTTGLSGTINNTYQFDGPTDANIATYISGVTSTLGAKKPSVENTHATCSKLTGTGYPHPSFVMNTKSVRIHYGNWPHIVTATIAEGLYYYEKYTGDVYGYSASGINTLRDDLAVLEDGYVVFVEGHNAASITITPAVSVSGTNVTIDGKPFTAYYLSPGSGGALNTLTNNVNISSNTLVELTVKRGTTVLFKQYFSPHFANSVYPSQQDPAGYEVRTARHLNQLNLLTNNWQGKQSTWAGDTYKQTRDIDFDKFTGFVPICSNPGVFTGSYYGGGNTISNLSAAMNSGSSSATGLFGEVGAAGSVSDVNIVSFTINATVRFPGILVGTNKGTITKCSVTDSSITASNDFVGGLVAVNYGRIESSSISNTTVISTGGNASAGGLVGENSTNGVISNCSTTDIQISGTNAQLGGFTGSNIGDISNSTSLSGSIVSTARNNSRASGGFVGKNLSSGTITNCSTSGYNFTSIGVVGGFVGDNNGVIDQCASSHYSDVSGSGGGITIGPRNGDQPNAGGFVGRIAGGSINNCYGISSVSPAGGDTVVGAFYAISTGGTISNVYCVTYNSVASSYLTFTSTPTNSFAYDGSNLDAIKSAFTAPTWGYATAYPFPAVVKNSAGEFVHYGNWPAITP